MIEYMITTLVNNFTVLRIVKLVLLRDATEGSYELKEVDCFANKILLEMTKCDLPNKTNEVAHISG